MELSLELESAQKKEKHSRLAQWDANTAGLSGIDRDRDERWLEGKTGKQKNGIVTSA